MKRIQSGSVTVEVAATSIFVAAFGVVAFDVAIPLLAYVNADQAARDAARAAASAPYITKLVGTPPVQVYDPVATTAAAQAAANAALSSHNNPSVFVGTPTCVVSPTQIAQQFDVTRLG
ncbi:MAG: hypothetical protein JST44_20470, partial [Cyanobacteria bacterium SZAS LIN-5]|nr:hypothetical protein [Cyanobacteria bacterium SZAS LIN-5]